ncbi:MAG: tetratricopeptide repeat-containing glycosyltransferase family protein [bacterium]|nr:tetratricopeptide repeat-containing glycosyltransferase family protein [bacterium]
MVQISKRLVVSREIPLDESKALISSLDTALAEYYCLHKDYDKGLKLYREILPKLNTEEYNRTLSAYIGFSMQYAQEMSSNKKFIEAIEIYRDIMKYSGYPINVYKNIGLCMKAIGNADLAIKFLKRFEEISFDKEDVYVYLADITYTDIKDNVKAIEYYEKALLKNQDNFSIYNMLGHLYSTCYQDKYKDKQIYYLTKAFELAPQNRIVVKNLAYVLGKFDEIERADEFYAKLMYLNPTHSDLHSYGAYLVKHQRFAEGFKFLQHRFQKEDLGNVAFPQIYLTNKKKRWNIKLNIENKHILVHFEQGFGDSIMFVRFLDELKKRCAKVSLVVQDGLINLFQSSDLGVDIYKEADVPKLSYDYYVPMMDLPIICETKPTTIPRAEGYLKVSRDRIEAYRKEHINDNNKLKIGIAFEGTLASKETDRDIPLHYLYGLMRLPDVEVYSFQVDDLSNQMDRIPEDAQLIRLGRTFHNWEDTACAMNCMDLMITTDNGVMNLAGALGIKTFGLFNRITEWRWFKTQGEDIAWYKSIKPFQAPTAGAWEIPVALVMKEVEELRCKKLAKEIKLGSKVLKTPVKETVKNVEVEEKTEKKNTVKTTVKKTSGAKTTKQAKPAKSTKPASKKKSV